MSTTQVQPYLFFGGRGGEALEFYRTALGAFSLRAPTQGVALDRYVWRHWR